MPGSTTGGHRMNRRKFLKATSGLFVPACFGIIKARGQLPIVGPQNRVAASGCGGGVGTYTIVQSKPATAASLAFTTNNTAGNLILVFYITLSTLQTPTDTRNSYSIIDSAIGGGSTFITAGYYAANIGAGANVVAVVGAFAMQIVEVSGVNTTTPLDQHSHTANNSTGASGANNLTAPAITTGQNNEFVVAYANCNGGGLSVGTNVAWTSPDGDHTGLWEYFKLATCGSVQGKITDATNSDPYAMISGSFKSA